MSRRGTYLIAAAAITLLLSACTSSGGSETENEGAAEQEEAVEAYQLQQQVPMTLEVSSSALKETGFLLKDFTCEGPDMSPQLSWTEVPSNTVSIAIVAEDVDAEEGSFAHWLMWGVPSGVQELAAGVSGSPDLSAGAIEGINGFSTIGWRGPCPPPRVIGSSSVSMGGRSTSVNTGVISNLYVINVYALDTEVSLDPGAARNDVLKAIEGHIIAGGAVETKYVSATVIRR